MACLPLLHMTSRAKTNCLDLVQNIWFDRISTFVVLVNCVTLGMFDPTDVDCTSVRCKTLQVFDGLIFAFFTLEMVLKMVALGLFGSSRYFASSSNRFDFTILVAGMVEYSLELISGGISVTFIRSLCVLRPLRIITRVTSMHSLMNLLIDTVPMLKNVLLFFCFVFLIFGIIGVELWGGVLQNRCSPEDNFTLTSGITLPSPYYRTAQDDEWPFICSLVQNNGTRSCNDLPAWKERGQKCLGLSAEPLVNGNASAMVPCVNWNQYYTRCQTGHTNPRKGAVNFDNIFYTWISIFQVMTQENWVEIMHYVMDGHSFYAFIYFVIFIIIGSIFMINLFMVVITSKISEFNQLKEQLMESEPGLYMSSDSLPSIIVPGEWYEELFSLVYNKLRCYSEYLYRMLRRLANREEEEVAMEMTNRDENHSEETGDEHSEARTCFWKCKDVWEKMRGKVRESKSFDTWIMVLIFINTVLMATEHHNQPVELTRALEVCNVVFTVIFFLEMIIKLCAFGPFDYLTKLWNLIDCIIVITSVCEVIVQSDGGLSILRAFRMLRIIKLLRFFPTLQRQITVMLKTVSNMSDFMKLLTLFIFIFSMLGMHLFGGKLHMKTVAGDMVPHRTNFDDLISASATVFQILTLEDWNVVMNNAMAATSPWAALYFVVLIVIGVYILFNLFLSFMVDRFLAEHKAKRSSSDSHESSSQSWVWLEQIKSNVRLRIQEMIEPYRPDWCETRKDWSIFLFSPENKFRSFCRSVTSHRMFDCVVMVFIFTNLITVALERSHILQYSAERLLIMVSNFIFTAVFVGEMTLKVVSTGLCMGDQAYLHSGWNIFDGILVSVYLTYTVLSVTGRSKIPALRLVYALHPLRFINRVPGLKLIGKALMASTAPIGNIFFLLCFFYVIYGILGVQLFEGKFFHCLGPDIRNITNKSDCLLANYTWTNRHYNFDNSVQALITLFVMSSKDGWSTIMHHAVDAVGVDKQPIIKNNLWMMLYFISFIASVAFFVMNVLVGVLVEIFCNHQQQPQDVEDPKSREMKKKKIKKEMRQGPLWSTFYQLSTCRCLVYSINLIIIVNIVTMAAEHFNQPVSMTVALRSCDYAFTFAFVMELVINIMGLGFWRFIKDRWNQLDVAVVLLSITGIVLEAVKINPTIISVMRVLRLGRVLKLLKMFTGMRELLDTQLQTMKKSGYLGIIFALLFHVYGGLAVDVFGELDCNKGNPCEGINRYTNFGNFPMALLALFQVFTGDNWSGILKDTVTVSSLEFFARLFFLTFALITQYVLLNVLLALFMKNLDASNRKAKEEADLKAEVEMELNRVPIFMLP